MFKVVGAMRRAGFASGKIVATLRAYPQGIAARCFERGRDDLARQVHLCLDKIDDEEAAKRAANTKTKGKLANVLNLRAELANDPLTADLVGFDEFTQQIVLKRPIPLSDDDRPSFLPRPWRDADDTALVEHLNRRKFLKVGKATAHDVIDLQARSYSFHPIRSYLDGLAWDGTHRLGRLLLDHCGAFVGDSESSPVEMAESLAYIEAITRAFFISAVARVFKPGCKVDHTPILEGPQGALKSSLLRVLAVRDEWFTDTLPHDLASKDAKQHLAGSWIVELSEIAQVRRGEIEAVKSFLSTQRDRFRPPYGRAEVEIPRQCVFIGTTNAPTYLKDVTGNRRFWPVRVDNIDLPAIRPIVDQLWAEAVTAWRAGEAWWLSAKMEAIAAGQQDARLERDPWHDEIEAWLSRRVDPWVTTADVLDFLQIEKARRDRAHEMRVGAVLHLLGCERRKRRIEGRSRWAYRYNPARREFCDAREREPFPPFLPRIFSGLKWRNRASSRKAVPTVPT